MFFVVVFQMTAVNILLLSLAFASLLVATSGSEISHCEGGISGCLSEHWTCVEPCAVLNQIPYPAECNGVQCLALFSECMNSCGHH